MAIGATHIDHIVISSNNSGAVAQTFADNLGIEIKRKMIRPGTSAQLAFAKLQVDSELAEDFIKYLTKTVLDERPDDMKFFDERIEPGLLKRLQHVLETPFRRLPSTEAIKILEDAIKQGKKVEYAVKGGTERHL